MEISICNNWKYIKKMRGLIIWFSISSDNNNNYKDISINLLNFELRIVW